jgi:hypothetical protein
MVVSKAIASCAAYFFVSSFFVSPLLAQQTAQSGVPLQTSVASQALDRFDADKSLQTLRGKVTAISGVAKWRNAKTIFWEDLKLGQEVRQGDHIRTEKDGQVKVEFTNGNVLFLKSHSQIFIDTLNLEKESGKYETVFKTKQARIKAEVNDRENLKTFEVRTPVAVAGARGTIFCMNVTPTSSEVFVEQGAVSFRNALSGQEREIHPGLATATDRSGKVAEPVVPQAEKLQEFQKAWDPVLLPPPGGPAGEPLPPPPDKTLPPLVPPPIIVGDLINKTNDQQLANALLDRTTSQGADKADYVTNPPPPVGDYDNDWLKDADEINLFHTSTTLSDTDADGLTDWEEARAQKTNPLVADTDGDGVDDRLDAFPNDPAILESRALIRTDRYNILENISGLRAEINTMLADSAERQKDYLMDRVSDAQMHKVLKDANGNWVRMEEYVFRPTPNKISILTLAYRTSAQLISMYWETTFSNSLDSLTSQQIRFLPWDVYLSATPNYGATAPIVYPTQMSVKFERYLSPGNSLGVTRSYNPPVYGGSYFTQTSNETVSGVAGGTNFGPTAFTVPGGSIVSGNPASFEYYWGGGSDQHAVFNEHIIDGNGAYVGSSYTFNSLWTVLGTNLPGFTSIGNNTYIEIRVSFNAQTWSIIYTPIPGLLWRGTPEWEPQLKW